MRVSRAIVGAFGAGFTMAIASSVVLLVVSSVVAFRGWPDDLSGVSDPEVASLTRADGPVTPPPPSSPPAVDLPSAPRPTPARETGRGAGSDAGRTPTATNGDAETVAPPAGAPAVPVLGGSSENETRRPAPSDRSVTDVVRDTTAAVSDTVVPVTPALGGALDSIGAAGADTADQVGQTVGGAVQQLQP